MSILKQLGYFSFRILKQTILYVLLALDLVGLVLTYYSSLQLPSWLFAITPIIAVFLAAFNIYRQGTADARIVFIEQKHPEYDCVNSQGSRKYSFTGAVHGHLLNFGPQSGVLENMTYRIGFNGIFDRDVLSRMLLSCWVSALVEGKVNPWEKQNFDKKIPLPLVLKPGDIQPFTLILDISISVAPNEESIMEILQWVKFINLKVFYTVRHSDGVVNRETNIDLSADRMFDAALGTDGGIQTFDYV